MEDTFYCINCVEENWICDFSIELHFSIEAYHMSGLGQFKVSMEPFNSIIVQSVKHNRLVVQL